MVLSYGVSEFVSRYFEPCQPHRVIPGLNASQSSLPHLSVSAVWMTLHVFPLQAMTIYSSLSNKNAQLYDKEESGDQADSSNLSEYQTEQTLQDFDKEDSFEIGDSSGQPRSKKPQWQWWRTATNLSVVVVFICITGPMVCINISLSLSLSLSLPLPLSLSL